MSANNSTLTPPRHFVSILMSSAGRFVVCRVCHLSLEFPSRLADVLPVAIVVAVQSSQRKGVGPDPDHLFIEVLAKVGYVKNAPAIVQVRVNQVFPEAFEHR